MLAGSPWTMRGATTDPIIPPKAAAPAMAAVERILSFSENQPWLILKRNYFSSLDRQDVLTLVLMVMRKGCPMAVMTWPVKVSQNLV